MEPTPFIQVKELSRSITTGAHRIDILTGVNFTIDAGQSVAVTGESGSGKSTLLGLLAGLDIPDQGEIMIDNQRISHLDEDQRAGFRGRYMGFVFQSFQLVPAFTALENVMLPLELQPGMENARQQAQALLLRTGLAHRLDHYPHQLSGGEQQRVALARAFVTTPKLLFADEPTGNLDQKTSAIIIDLMFELNREHDTTLILVTHEQGLAQRCQRMLTLDQGRIQERADTAPAAAT